MSIQIDANRRGAQRRIAAMGGGQQGALALLGDHVVKLLDELTRIGVQSQQPIGIRDAAIPSARGLAAIIRNGCDPFGRRDRARGGGDGISTDQFAAKNRDVNWDHHVCDGSMHATGHLLEWPKHDVRAQFLQGLLLAGSEVRTVAVVMNVLGPRKATRRAEKRAEERASESWLRRRVGRRTSARDRTQDAHANRDEMELAHGHALVQFAGFVTVSVPRDAGVGQLRSAFTDVESRALQVGLRLELMAGEQQEAFTFTLPLCRGLLG